MKILITGANGMLARDLCAELEKNNHALIKTDVKELDITSLKRVRAFTADKPIELIINCAAATNVDGCETDPDGAYKLNSIGPRNLAIAANELSIPLVHFSTDYVFDGETAVPYTEFDATNPKSVYGASKLAGEKYVLAHCSKYYIIRTQWLYGAGGNNFVKTIIRLAREKGQVRVVDDQFGCPTATYDLAAATARLIQTGAYGTYHITNQGSVSWYGFTREIFKLAGIKADLEPCDTAAFPRPAPRPANSALDNYALRLNGFEPMRTWQEALLQYLSNDHVFATP